MTSSADIPALRAQLARAASTARPTTASGEAAAPDRTIDKVAEATATRPPPRRSMTLAAGKYYVTEDGK